MISCAFVISMKDLSFPDFFSPPRSQSNLKQNRTWVLVELNYLINLIRVFQRRGRKCGTVLHLEASGIHLKENVFSDTINLSF